MRKALVEYLKDTVYTIPGGAAQWHYIKADADQLEVIVLGSGSLFVLMPDEENGTPHAHLGGKRAREIGFFPAGGWSGYTWEELDEGAMVMAAAAKQGIAVPR